MATYQDFEELYQIPGVLPETLQYSPGAYSPGAFYGRYGVWKPGASATPEEDRNWAYGVGTDMMNDFGFQAGENERKFDEAEGAGQALAWRDIDSGGLRPEEIETLRENQDSLRYLAPDEFDYEATHLTPEQKTGILGDVNAGREYFQPEAENTYFGQGADNRRGSISRTGEALRGSFDPEALRRSGEYVSGVEGALGQFGTDIREAIDPNTLRLDPNFKQNYLMSEAEKQDITTKAGRDTGLYFQARRDDLERSAHAAGVNPLGVAAAGERLNREGAMSAADALQDARIGVSREAADRQKSAEQMRLDAERGLGSMRLAAASDYAKTRLGAAGDLESARVRGEESVADKNLTNARYLGDKDFENETRLAQEQLGLFQDQSARGYQMARTADQESVARNKAIADTDLQSGRDWYGMKTQGVRDAYDRRQDVSNRQVDYQYGRGTSGRNYLYSRPELYSGRQMGYDEMRTKTFGTTGQLGQNATETRVRDSLEREKLRQQKGSLWGKIIGAGIGAASALATGGASAWGKAASGALKGWGG